MASCMPSQINMCMTDPDFSEGKNRNAGRVHFASSCYVSGVETMLYVYWYKWSTCRHHHIMHCRINKLQNKLHKVPVCIAKASTQFKSAACDKVQPQVHHSVDTSPKLMDARTGCPKTARLGRAQLCNLPCKKKKWRDSLSSQSPCSSRDIIVTS